MTDVFFVSNTRLYRESVAEMLARDGRLRIAGTAESAAGALEILAGGERCVVLLDMALPESLAAARALVGSSRQQIKVVAFGISETRSDVVSCAQAGISGYVCRQSTLDELVTAVVCAERGELHCSPRIAAALMDSVARLGASRPAEIEVALTERELEIAGLLDQGLGNREIALALHITVATVKVHVHHILEKLGSCRRGEAAAKLRLSGLLPSQRLRLLPSPLPASTSG